jgi:hypothetical protein
MKSKFNEELKAKLDAAGYTENEQILGTMTAEVKAAIDLTRAMGRSPLMALPIMALSSTVVRVLAFTSGKLDADPRRIVAVSDIVGEACFNKAAETMNAEGFPIPRPAQSGSSVPASAPLDASPAATAKDINN